MRKLKSIRMALVLPLRCPQHTFRHVSHVHVSDMYHVRAVPVCAHLPQQPLCFSNFQLFHLFPETGCVCGQRLVRGCGWRQLSVAPRFCRSTRLQGTASCVCVCVCVFAFLRVFAFSSRELVSPSAHLYEDDALSFESSRVQIFFNAHTPGMLAYGAWKCASAKVLIERIAPASHLQICRHRSHQHVLCMHIFGGMNARASRRRGAA
jgi:hypothetical protein